MPKASESSSSSSARRAAPKTTPKVDAKANSNAKANLKPKVGGTSSVKPPAKPSVRSSTKPPAKSPAKAPAKSATKSAAKATSKNAAKSPAKSGPRSKPAATSPRKAASEEKSARRRMPTVRPNGATVLVALVVILGIAVLAPTAQRYIAQRQYVAQLQADLVATQQSVDEIETERDRWSDPAYIQSQARGRLLFVMPGDTSYLVLDAPASTRQQQNNISTELHETQTSWLDSFVDSLVTAGTAPAPAPTPGE